jgi:predicted SprT family Zn-dependent metalloprotease
MKLSDVRDLALRLMTEHGLHGWSLQFSKSCRVFGHCSYKKQQITLSAPLSALNTETRVRNTILHEVAHALVGPGHKHNKFWKQKAITIGCDGERCYDSSAVIKPPKRYKGTCLNCNKQIFRNIRAKLYCTLCHSLNYPKTYAFQWELNPDVLSGTENP